MTSAHYMQMPELTGPQTLYGALQNSFLPQVDFFFSFETVSERVQAGGRNREGQKKKERENNKQAPHPGQSPTQGLISNLEIIT